MYCNGMVYFICDYYRTDILKYNFVKGMVQANDVVRPMSRHSERTPLVLGGTQLHGEKICFCPKSKICSKLLTSLP